MASADHPSSGFIFGRRPIWQEHRRLFSLPNFLMTKARIASLDGLRGAAALAVALPHFILAIVPSTACEIISSLAVEVFFVLSGFVLAPQILLCLRERRLGTLGIFLTRRWMRTVPLYLLALTLIALMTDALWTGQFWYYVFYVQNFAAPPTKDFFPIAWSLSVEEWFYVAFPTILILSAATAGRGDRRWAIVTAVAFIAAITVARAVAEQSAIDWGADIRRVVVFRVDSIAYGFLLYLLIQNADLKSGRLRVFLLWTIPTATLIAGSVAYLSITSGAARTIYPIATALFGCACVLGATTLPVNAAWLRRSFGFLGCISYSLYLFHLAIMTILLQALPGLPLPISMIIYAIACGTVCALIYRFIERPILAARPAYRTERDQAIAGEFLSRAH